VKRTDSSFLAAAVIGALCAAPALAAPAAPPASPSSSTEVTTARTTPADAAQARDSAGQANTEAQLQAARAKLDADAKEVARLSMQMSRPLIQRYMTIFDGSPHSVIGVEIAMESNPQGARVLDVSPGGPAAEAGIRAGDIISSVNGADVKGDESGRHAVSAIRQASPDSKLNIRVLRDGKPRDFTVVARPIANEMYFRAPRVMPGSPALPVPPAPPIGDRFAMVQGDVQGGPPVFTLGELGVPSLFNMQLATLSPGLGHYFGTEKGVLVVRAPTQSPFKLQDGDVILSIDGREPTSGAHATRILASYQPGEKVMLSVMRDHKRVQLQATLPERTAGRGGRGGAAWLRRALKAHS